MWLGRCWRAALAVVVGVALGAAWAAAVHADEVMTLVFVGVAGCAAVLCLASAVLAAVRR
ncbi:hypothetical protein AB0F17_34350 [Nonomuraea sp. NPDC026600]|uniref:hypothetical protein n=1 Tax=Nonomuraea sp. NPDC026600 TaxID=3155363 RepID=UPI00340C7B6E